MSFAPIQKEVDQWISHFEEGYFPPLPMLARLTEEVGELARVLMHQYGGKKPKTGEDPGNAAEEIADAIFVHGLPREFTEHRSRSRLQRGHEEVSRSRCRSLDAPLTIGRRRLSVLRYYSSIQKDGLQSLPGVPDSTAG